MGALKDAARKGRGGDTRLGHLSNGDVVFPTERLDEPTRALVFEIMKQKGIKDPHRFQVGHLHNAKNPKTRLPMFMEGGDAAGGASGGSGGDAGAGGGSTGSGDSDTAGGGVGTGTGTGQGATAGNPGGISGASSNAGSATGAPTAEALAAAPESNAIGATTATGPTVGIGNAIAGLSATDTTNPGQTTQGVAQTGNPMGLGELGLGVATDPIGTIAGLGINSALSLGIPGFGLGRALVNTGLGLAGLPGVDPGGLAVQGIEGLGRGFAAQAANATAGTPQGTNTGPGTGLGTGGPGNPDKDTGAGLRALGGGVGVNLDEMLKNRLGSGTFGQA